MPDSSQADDAQPSAAPLSNAERQARWRARRRTQAPTPAPAPGKAAPANKHSRPRRWRAAVAELLALQAEYAAWLETLPDSAMAEMLAAIVELDIDALASTELPRGYGRD